MTNLPHVARAADELRHLRAVHADVDGDAPHLLPHLGHLVHQVAGRCADCHTATAAQIRQAICQQALQMVREAAAPHLHDSQASQLHGCRHICARPVLAEVLSDSAPCSIESTEVLGKPVPHYHLFNGLLSLLAVLHAYWCAAALWLWRQCVTSDVQCPVAMCAMHFVCPQWRPAGDWPCGTASRSQFLRCCRRHAVYTRNEGPICDGVLCAGSR